MKKVCCCQSGLFLICLLVTVAHRGRSESEIDLGYRVMLQVPGEYTPGFTGRAFLMETTASLSPAPDFKAALSVEAVGGGQYSCALEAFLGDVRVWNSGHYSRFLTTDECVVELSRDGDLRLKGGPVDRIGWRTGTSGQGVQRLRLLQNGNLVLVDGLNRIKWQSFSFPTDVLLLGHRVDVSTRLTAFPSSSTNSTSFYYSLEIEADQLALYFNFGSHKYSYWNLRPPDGLNISSVELGPSGLKLFDEMHHRIAQVASTRRVPIRFLSLGNETGNLGLYFYAPELNKFKVSFQALNATCDLPTACKPYGICTFSDECSCIRFGGASDCSKGISGRFCGGADQAEMIELRGVSSVLRGDSDRRSTNVSKEACSERCLSDCKCAAALYSSGGEGGRGGECDVYGLVTGVRQVEEEGTGVSYFLKVPKGTTHSQHWKSSGLKKWVVMVVGAVDGLIVLLVLGGLTYYVVWKRRERDLASNGEQT